MASLEPPSGDGKKPSKYVSVMVEHQNTEFMICTLEPERNLQIPLDHMFVAGEEVTFFLNGEGTVHLTGYLVPDDYDDFDEDLDEEDEDEEASDEDSDSVQQVSAKRKNEALESSPEAVGKKAKVDLKLAKDSPNKTSKVEEKESINALKKKNEEKNFNKNLNDNKVSKIVPQNNKVESDESEEEDDSDEDEEESDQDMDESLGLIDKEAVEADDSDDEEEDEESSDESGLN
jgi:FK506-binding nuclear protein